MTVVLTGAGGLFTRLGKRLHLINVCHEFLGESGSVLATDIPTLLAADIAQGDAAAVDIRDTYDTLPGALVQTRSGMGALFNTLRTAAQELLIAQVDTDSPLITRDVQNALQTLIAQMRAASQSVQANAVTVTVTPAGGNVGNGIVVASDLDGSGRELELAFAEVIDVDVTSSGVPGNETIRFRGEAAQTDSLAFDYPAGSGCNTSFTSIDPATNNLLTNGGFDSFTGGVPTGWASTGFETDPGVEFEEETTQVHRGAKSLQFNCHPTNVDSVILQQQLTGLQSKTPYAFNCFVKRSGTITTGVFQVELWDGSAIINDESGNPNSFTFNASAIATSFESKSGFFRLPEPVPDTVYIRIRTPTALNDGAGPFVWMDSVSLVQAGQLYTGGPFVGAFSGSTNWSLDDLFSLTVGNNYAGGFQIGFDQLFNTRESGLLVPSSGSPTISGSLIG